MPTLDDVFSEIDSRIKLLNTFHKIINYYCHLKDDFDVAKVERNIHLFGIQALPRINLTLKEIKALQDKGPSIITTVIDPNLFESDDYRLKLSSSKLKADNEKLRMKAYLLLKTELDFYFVKLKEIRIGLKDSKLLQFESKSITLELKEIPAWINENPKEKPILSMEQSVLLFHYLKRNKVILSYKDTTLSEIIMTITGYSRNTSRSSLGHVEGKLKTSKNLNGIRSVLNDIISDIDLQLNKPLKK
jgi:hypothetical protein